MSRTMIAATGRSAAFFVSRFVTFPQRTSPAFSMANPIAIHTKRPPMRNSSAVLMQGPIPSKRSVTSTTSVASYAKQATRRTASAVPLDGNVVRFRPLRPLVD